MVLVLIVPQDNSYLNGQEKWYCSAVAVGANNKAN